MIALERRLDAVFIRSQRRRFSKRHPDVEPQSSEELLGCHPHDLHPHAGGHHYSTFRRRLFGFGNQLPLVIEPQHIVNLRDKAIARSVIDGLRKRTWHRTCCG